MRLEELANNNFIKETDSVERYLLDIIKQYFDSNNIDDDSREYIIRKAVAQMKEELNIDNAGVVSVNGQTGEVTITLEDLGGEPLINPKLSAFNVNFGVEEGTACRGNDPRLSDDRKPLPHEHTINQINGLDGELSTINNNILLLSTKTHKHDNLNVLNKLIYSGNEPEIDLTLLDNAKDKIEKKSEEVDSVITEIQTKMNNLMADIADELNQYELDYANVKTYVKEQNEIAKKEAEEYCDTALEAKKKEIDAELANKVSNKQLNTIIDLLNEQFNILYETNITGFITNNTSNIEYEINIPTEISEALASLNDKQYKVDFYISYKDPNNNKSVSMNLPFIHVKSNEILYIIKGELLNKSVVRITSTKKESSSWLAFIDSAIIKLKITVKNNIKEV